MNIFTALFVMNMVLSVITLWSLSDSVVIYINVYKTYANITAVNPTNVSFYVVKQFCDYSRTDNTCFDTCLTYDVGRRYEVLCDCMKNKCGLNKQLVAQPYLTKIYIGWGLFGFLMFIIIIIILYICQQDNQPDNRSPNKVVYRCTSCSIFLLCLILFSVGFIYSSGLLTA